MRLARGKSRMIINDINISTKADRIRILAEKKVSGIFTEPILLVNKKFIGYKDIASTDNIADNLGFMECNLLDFS